MSEPRDVVLELEAVSRRIDAAQERLRAEVARLDVVGEYLRELGARIAAEDSESGRVESERAEET